MKNKDDLLLSILHSPINNTSNNATVEKKEKERKEYESSKDDTLSIDYTFGKAVESEEKYLEKMKKKAQDDPTSVVIDTPRGEMTLAEAMREGYNPETGEFQDELKPPVPDENLSPELLAKLEGLMQNPGDARQLPPGMPMSEEEMMMQQMAGGGEPMPEEGMVTEEPMMEGEAPVPTEEELMMMEQGLLQ